MAPSGPQMPTLRRASRIGVATHRRAFGGPLDADLDTLATALYIRIDELLQSTMFRRASQA
jgi:hypothetical protein